MNSSDGGTGTTGHRPQGGPRATYPAQVSAGNRRRWFVGLSALVLLAGVAVAFVGYHKFATPDVSGEVTGYQILTPGSVAVQFTVTRKEPKTPVSCVVRARSKDQSESGRREILVPPGADKQVGVRAEVATSRPPVIGEVFGCTTSVPAYLTAAGAPPTS